ncbi:MAG: ATP-dependent Clp protease adaptor ClpS [Candidatus Hydrogenedens sp.]|jgi:ATP-dependent Clp protease adaptor protein ClpS|nr:ATP-dependent Clp protease adaptor ClpS [Candidatus Hydrogenedens sp.]
MSLTPTVETDIHVHDDIEEPGRYLVILLNDDFTTMDFVVMILMDIFSKNEDEAVKLMLQVHHEGMGIAGVYVKDIAEAKREQVHAAAAAEGFPLTCIVKPE